MFVYLLLIIQFFVNSREYELKQVVALSRHNIRVPYNHPVLKLVSPKKWPSWREDVGELTAKGCQLERFMGKYFYDWMIQEQLLNNNISLTDQVFVCATKYQRTKDSAKSFVEGAFGKCVNVYNENSTEIIPIFNFQLSNISAEFLEIVKNEMYKKMNNTNIQDTFLELNRLVDIENSSYCKIENVCDFNELNSDIDLELNKMPNVSGALKIAWDIVDAFLMAYYDGMAAENVAWGQIHTTRQWNTLTKILKTHNELRYKTKILDKHLASSMLKYLTDIFQNGQKKFYFLSGHGANVCLLMSCLRFKDYVLHDQIEDTPIGGKLVFQKWYDEINNQDLLRVSYVYQSTKQIRDGAVLSLQNPPQWATLELENCTIDKNGFCPWIDFIKILKNVLK